MLNWLKKIFKKETNQPSLDDLFVTVQNGNSTTLYDKKMVEYLKSELPNPAQKDLDTLFKSTKEIIISERVSENSRLVEKEIVRRHTKEDIKIVQEKLVLKEEPRGHLMCIGSYYFNFKDDKGEVNKIEYLGYGSVRWESKWKNDASLSNPLAFLEWLTELGIEKPLVEWTKYNERIELSKRQMEEWKAVAPKALVKRMEKQDECMDNLSREKLYTELLKEIPNETVLILTLFKVYGNTFGVWNGFSSYEILPANLLMQIDIEKLNQVIENHDLEPEQKEGIARFLSDWAFMKQRKSDIDRVSDKVKAMLLSHLEVESNDEKMGLFKKRVLQH